MRTRRATEFIDKAKKKHHNKYSYVDVVYKRSGEKVIILCPVHGPFTQRPSDHIRGDGCPQCKFEKIASLKRHTLEQFIKKAKRVHGELYDYSQVKYVNAITKVKIMCPKHGEFWQTPDKHTTSKTQCPKCSHNISRGEQIILDYLMMLEVPFEREKRFDDLYGTTKNSRLRYDFWIPTKNLLIEYDGEQHKTPINIKGRLSPEQIITKFAATKKNDRKKNKYAKKKGMRLVRIPHLSQHKGRILNRLTKALEHQPQQYME